MTDTFKLVESGWFQVMNEAVALNEEEYRLLSPFIKLQVAQNILEDKVPNSIRVITRFNLDDFCEGVSDTSALRFLLEKGASIRGIKQLHAKVYIFGKRRAIVTSANLTQAALTRNHEFGLVADEPGVVGRCGEYFETLWSRAGGDLTAAMLDEWEEKLTAVKASGARPSSRRGLGDVGVSVRGMSEFPGAVPMMDEGQQAFVKFFGISSGRANRDASIFQLLKEDGAHWACAYPKGQRPRQAHDGAIMFIGKLVASPNDTLIYGRAVALAHVEGRDDATAEEIAVRDWKEQWPHYIRVHHADFVAGNLANGVSLAELMDELGSDVFASTQRNAERGDGNTNPRHAFNQKPAVELSLQGLALLTRRLEDAFAAFGKLPVAELEALDWPTIRTARPNDLSTVARKLLGYLVRRLNDGTVVVSKPETFPSYTDALVGIGVIPWEEGRRGIQFKKEGGIELDGWLRLNCLPALTGLVVNRETSMPGGEYFSLNGHRDIDFEWWLGQVEKATQESWIKYL